MLPREDTRPTLPLVGFDSQPVLRGELLELRPLRADDVDALHAVASDPGIFAEQLASGGALVVSDRATGAVVGMSRFHGYDAARSEVEIGWTFLARSHWGGVANGELKRLMLGHAFRVVRHVVFLVGPENLRSRRAVEKLGAVEIGMRHDAAGHESVAYRLDAAAFRAR
jgi:RimJ/RimL family protein N-acetyltransferase